MSARLGGTCRKSSGWPFLVAISDLCCSLTIFTVKVKSHVFDFILTSILAAQYAEQCGRSHTVVVQWQVMHVVLIDVCMNNTRHQQPAKTRHDWLGMLMQRLGEVTE